MTCLTGWPLGSRGCLQTSPLADLGDLSQIRAALDDPNQVWELWQPKRVLCSLVCKEAHMATNLAIDPELLEHALRVSGERTKKATVTLALQEFIARREQAAILDLFGTLDWDEGFDYKAECAR